MVEVMVALLTLIVLEVVLGIDNLVMVSINVGKLPKEQQAKGRMFGLGGALVMRVVLLFSISWVVGLTDAVFSVLDHAFSWRDLVLIGGGLFLVKKSATEIFREVEGGHDHTTGSATRRASFVKVIAEITLLDIIFSLDSVITAVGMVEEIWIMIVAVVFAMVIMIIFAKPVGEFVQEHASVKTLALAFLTLIGAVLIAEGCGKHIEKGFIYGPMGFAALITVIELRRQKNATKRTSSTDESAREAA